MKKKSTLLVVLLSFVCLVCAAIGFTACSDDKGGNGGNGGKENIKTVKVGETNIGTVNSDGVVCNVEGEFSKEYVVTVKSGDTVCDTVLVNIPDVAAYATGSYGTFEFVNGKDYTIKFTSETEVKNVTVVMAEKTYPEGSLKNPIALTFNTDKTYSVGFDHVWYSISVSETGEYQITFTGDNTDKIAVVCGDTIDTDGYQFLLDPQYDGVTVFTLTADKTYYIGIASDALNEQTGAYATLTGTLKVVNYNPIPQPTTYSLSVELAVGNVTINANERIDLKVNTEAGKTYTITSSNNAVLFGKDNKAGSITFKGKDFVELENVATITATSATKVEGVTFTLTVADDSEITLGQAYTVEYVAGTSPQDPGSGPIEFTLKVTQAGNYTITFGGTEVANAVVTIDGIDGDLTPDNATCELAEGTYTISCEAYEGFSPVSATYTITVAKAA